MDFDKLKIHISWSGNNVGLTILEGERVVDWNKLTRNEQVKILNGLMGMYNLFEKFLKE